VGVYAYHYACGMDPSPAGIVFAILAGLIVLGAITAAKWQVLRDQLERFRRKNDEGPPE
jgi:hypothetical protein